MEESVKTDIAVIKVQIQNITDQIKRFVSHLDSEQRVTTNISKRVDTLQHTVDRLLDDMKKVDKLQTTVNTLQNSVDQLVAEKNKHESDHRWKFDRIIAIVSLLTTIGTLIIMAIKG